MISNRYTTGDRIWYISAIPYLQVVEGEIVDIYNGQFYVVESAQTQGSKPKYLDDIQVFPDMERALREAKDRITIVPYKP